jgi:hypothetical protein
MLRIYLSNGPGLDEAFNDVLWLLVHYRHGAVWTILILNRSKRLESMKTRRLCWIHNSAIKPVLIVFFYKFSAFLITIFSPVFHF